MIPNSKKIIVGLGNTGNKYQNTRHNAGFMFVDKLAEKLGLPWQNEKITKSQIAKNAELILAKPQTMMNFSGEAVKKLAKQFSVSSEDLCIAHDDLDIKLGDYKIQKRVGPKVHNGLTSVENHLKTKDFWRVRVGIDYRDPNNRTEGETYVLQNFLPDELEILEKVFDKILPKLVQLI